MPVHRRDDRKGQTAGSLRCTGHAAGVANKTGSATGSTVSDGKASGVTRRSGQSRGRPTAITGSAAGIRHSRGCTGAVTVLRCEAITGSAMKPSYDDVDEETLLLADLL